jgi:uncharacterized protein (DUF1501 family)
MINRRLFLKQTGCAAVALGFAPLFIKRAIAQGALSPISSPSPASRKVFVLIIQRGAMDGLSMVPPIGESYYYSSRPTIAIPQAGELAALRLDGQFGAHPSLIALKPMWEEGSLAFVHQTGSPNSSRSHFDAQDFFESGTPGDKNTQDGFLNRALLSAPGDKNSPLRAVAMQPNMPRVLQGPFPAISMDSLRDFNLKTQGGSPKDMQNFTDLYQQAVDQVFRGVGNEVFESLKTVDQVRQNNLAKGDLGYPKAQIGKRLSEIASLIKAGVGLEFAVTDMGGWDTHINQGNGKGQLADRLRELSESIAAFRKDLGPLYANVCVVTATEFGRTVKEDGTRGTDHGHGSVMMVLGGSVQGKKVYGKWQPLKPENLFEGRDLPVTTDSRDVLAEVMQRHMGIRDFSRVFPKYEVKPEHFPGLFRA